MLWTARRGKPLHVDPTPEQTGGEHHVLDGRPEPDVHLALEGIERPECSVRIREDVESVRPDVESPRLGVVRGGGEDGRREKATWLAHVEAYPPAPPRLEGRPRSGRERVLAGRS